MHSRRAEVEAALRDLRDHVPGGVVASHFGLAPPVRDPSSPYGKEQQQRNDAYFDRIAELLAAAVGAPFFEPIVFEPRATPLHRSPPPVDHAMHLAWALHRASAPMADPSVYIGRKEASDARFIGVYNALTVFSGPLHVQGEVEVRGTVAVVGDLVVDGGLHVGGKRGAALAVIGNETTKALFSDSDHLVTGDLNVGFLLTRGPAPSVRAGGVFRATVGVADRGWRSAWRHGVPRTGYLHDDFTLASRELARWIDPVRSEWLRYERPSWNPRHAMFPVAEPSGDQVRTIWQQIFREVAQGRSQVRWPFRCKECHSNELHPIDVGDADQLVCESCGGMFEIKAL